MVNILAKFENIGPSHMMAPNDDGGLGFGGHCFPKDTEAFLDFTNSEILKQVIDTNNKLKN
jgi:UDP-glucose 6-dehydrogenase